MGLSSWYDFTEKSSKKPYQKFSENFTKNFLKNSLKNPLKNSLKISLKIHPQNDLRRGPKKSLKKGRPVEGFFAKKS